MFPIFPGNANFSEKIWQRPYIPRVFLFWRLRSQDMPWNDHRVKYQKPTLKIEKAGTSFILSVLLLEFMRDIPRNSRQRKEAQVHATGKIRELELTKCMKYKEMFSRFLERKKIWKPWKFWYFLNFSLWYSGKLWSALKSLSVFFIRFFFLIWDTVGISARNFKRIIRFSDAKVLHWF